MTENEARQWTREHYGVSRETDLSHLAEFIIGESTHQNLIAASTLSTLWSRHIVDSLQLLAHGAERPGEWIDVGSGAGFPGMVVAVAGRRPVVLIEPRKRRAAFLVTLAERLGVSDLVAVLPTKVESVSRHAAVISARAVASLDQLFDRASGCATIDTLWLLPKGRSAAAEVEVARRTWHGTFRLVPSITDEESRIVIADRVSRR